MMAQYHIAYISAPQSILGMPSIEVSKLVEIPEKIMKYRGKINIMAGDIMEVPDEIKEWVDKGGMERALSSLPADDVLGRNARTYSALSDPIRLRILHLLSHHPLCVCLMKKALDISDSKLSYHLSVLKESGLIIGERRKNWIIYSITGKGRIYL